MVELDERKMRGMKRSFVNGIFHGMGAVVGGILALTLLGWFLWLLGVVPGFDSFERSLGEKVHTFEAVRP